MEALEAALLSSLSSNNAVRTKAEETLRAATAVPGVVRCLASMLADPAGHAEPARMMAGVLLQHWVKALWSSAPPSLLPPADRVEVRALVLHAMFDPRCARRIRTAASLVAALIATHDWPENWPDLVPSLLAELSKDSASPLAAAGPLAAGPLAAAGVGAGAAAGENEAQCAQCLLYMAEKLAMKRVPGLFRECYPALLRAATAEQLPRRARRKVVAVVASFFSSLGALVSMANESSLLVLLAPAMPAWVQLVTAACQNSNRNAADGFCLELSLLASLVPAVELFPEVAGPHLQRLMPPLWALLLQATAHHEAQLFRHGRGSGAEDIETEDTEDGAGGDAGYTSEGDRLGFEPLVEQILELLTAIAGNEEPAVYVLLPDSGVAPVVTVALRLAQAAPQHRRLWAEDPGSFLLEDEEENTNSYSIRARAATLLCAAAARHPAAAVAALATSCLRLLREAAAAATAPAGVAGKPWQATEVALFGLGLCAPCICSQMRKAGEAVQRATAGGGAGAAVAAASPAAVSNGRSGPNGKIKGKGKARAAVPPPLRAAAAAAAATAVSSEIEDLSRGAASMGVNYADLQGVLVAAAAGNFPHCATEPFVRARALWAATRLSALLAEDQLQVLAGATAACMRPGAPLSLRLFACRALGTLCRKLRRRQRRRRQRQERWQQQQQQQQQQPLPVSNGSNSAAVSLDARMVDAVAVGLRDGCELASVCPKSVVYVVAESLRELVRFCPAATAAAGSAATADASVAGSGGGGGGGGGVAALVSLCMSLWSRHWDDHLLVEVVVDLLLSLARAPGALAAVVCAAAPSLAQLFRLAATDSRLGSVSVAALELVADLCQQVRAAAAAQPASAAAMAAAGQAAAAAGQAAAAAAPLSAGEAAALLIGPLLPVVSEAAGLALTTNDDQFLRNGCACAAAYISALLATAAAEVSPGATGPAGRGAGGEKMSIAALQPFLALLARVLGPDLPDAAVMSAPRLSLALARYMRLDGGGSNGCNGANSGSNGGNYGSNSVRSGGESAAAASLVQLMRAVYLRKARCTSSLLADQLLFVLAAVASVDHDGAAVVAAALFSAGAAAPASATSRWLHLHETACGGGAATLARISAVGMLRLAAVAAAGDAALQNAVVRCQLMQRAGSGSAGAAAGAGGGSGELPGTLRSLDGMPVPRALLTAVTRTAAAVALEEMFGGRRNSSSSNGMATRGGGGEDMDSEESGSESDGSERSEEGGDEDETDDNDGYLGGGASCGSSGGGSMRADLDGALRAATIGKGGDAAAARRVLAAAAGGSGGGGSGVFMELRDPEAFDRAMDAVGMDAAGMWGADDGDAGLLMPEAEALAEPAAAVDLGAEIAALLRSEAGAPAREWARLMPPAEQGVLGRLLGLS